MSGNAKDLPERDRWSRGPIFEENSSAGEKAMKRLRSDRPLANRDGSNSA